MVKVMVGGHWQIGRDAEDAYFSDGDEGDGGARDRTAEGRALRRAKMQVSPHLPLTL